MRLLICQLYLFLLICSRSLLVFFLLLLWMSTFVTLCCDGIFHRCSAWALSAALILVRGFYGGGGDLKCVFCGRGTRVSLLLLMFALIWTKPIFRKQIQVLNLFLLLFAMMQRYFVRLLRMLCMWGFWNVCSIFYEWLDSNDQIFWDEEKMSKYSSGMYFLFPFSPYREWFCAEILPLDCQIQNCSQRNCCDDPKRTLLSVLFSVWLSIAVGNRKQ